MIAIDTSAIVAILLVESDAARYASQIEDAASACISSASFVELNVVMYRRNQHVGLKAVSDFMTGSGIAIQAFTEAQARIAADAYHRYPVLNFGDCFSYALAKDLHIPLLYKGDDFGQTDLRSV